MAVNELKPSVQPREAAAIVQRELVALRRTLKVILGATHRDYQVLRLSRVAQDEEEIDAIDTNASQPVTPESVAA